jgi:Sporulation and spore germination
VKSTNLLACASAALIASATLMSAMAASAKSYSVTVYQGAVGTSEDCSKVSPVTRTVPVKPTPTIAVRELVRGLKPSEKKKGLSSVFSAETADIVQRVRNVKGNVYVSFTPKALTTLNNAGTSCGRDQFFAQMEKTLNQFPGVKNVVFAVDSKPADFYSLLELECPAMLGTECTGRDF